MPNEIDRRAGPVAARPRAGCATGMYRAPTPRERERWHALWLLSQGWSAAAVARAFERDPHTIGAWLDDFRQHGPAGPGLRPHRRLPPALDPAGQAALKAAVQAPPPAAGIEQAELELEGVRPFIARPHRAAGSTRSTCLRYLHRLGFVRKRPKKRLLKADAGEARRLRRALRGPAGARPGRRAPRSGSSMRPTSGPMPTCAGCGC